MDMSGLQLNNLGAKAELGFCLLSDILIEDRWRKEYTDIEKLAETIKTNGLVNPLTVMRLPPHDKIYKLLAGGRRYYACELANINIVPIRIYPEGLSNFECRIIELTENVDRQELTWYEEVTLRAELHHLYVKKEGPYQKGSIEAGQKVGHSAADTAKVLKVSQATMSDDLELADYVERLPALKVCQNRAEARTMLRQAFKHYTHKKLAAVYNEKVKDRTITERQQSLVESYIVGDFFDKTDSLEACFDFLEIDPPYGIDIIDLVDVSTGTKLLNEYIYKEIPKEDYLPFLKRLAERSYKLLKNERWLICWFGFTWYQAIYDAFIAAGFVGPRTPAAWMKDVYGACNCPRLQMCPSYDVFFYFRKGVANLIQPGRKNIYRYIPIPSGKHIHPTQRPLKLIQEIIGSFVPTGSLVCVPFAGSGVSLVAAHSSRMEAIGFDLSQEYKNAFTAKVMESGMEGWD